jgi:hypothetical protein
LGTLLEDSERANVVLNPHLARKEFGGIKLGTIKIQSTYQLSQF